MRLHEKIDYLLNACNVTNSKLSKRMNIDASLISKWRRGVRHPVKKAYLLQICETVVPYLQQEYLSQDLANISGISLSKLTDIDQAANALLRWLCEDTEGQQAAASIKGAFGAELFYSERLTAHRRGRIIALDTITEKLKMTDRISCLRIFVDEPYEWMRIFEEYLNTLEVESPELFTRVDRVSLLVSCNNHGNREFLCGWEIMNHFTDYCEVTVAMMDERYFGALQHFIVIAADVGAITSFGFSGSRSAFSLVHENRGAIQDMIKDYDALFNRSQTIIREYPSFTAREQAQKYNKMLKRDQDIYYRSYNIPPGLFPPSSMQSLVHRTRGSGAVSHGADSVFHHDIHQFLKHNRIYTTFPIYRPDEIERGIEYFPHTYAQSQPNLFTPADYLTILRYVLAIYEDNANLIIKTVKPGEIGHDFLAQELNRYSLSRENPRNYTYVSTHPAVVANAIVQVKGYFSDAPKEPIERENLASLLRDTIRCYDRHLAVR